MLNEKIFSNKYFLYKGNDFSGIYGILNHTTGKWYVGESINVLRRTKKYLKGIISKKQWLIHQSIQKYGIENFTCYKLEECAIEQLFDREVYWGEKLNSLSPDGYNLRLGGNKKSLFSNATKEKMRSSQIGKKHSKETIEKIKFITSHMSQETKEKMRSSQIGKKHSKETIEKLRLMSLNNPKVKLANFGRKLSDEHKKKIAIGMKLTSVINWLENEAPWFCKTSLEEIKNG